MQVLEGRGKNDIEKKGGGQTYLLVFACKICLC